MLWFIVILISTQITIATKCYNCNFCDTVSNTTATCDGYLCVTIYMAKKGEVFRHCSAELDKKIACEVAKKNLKLEEEKLRNRTYCGTCYKHLCNNVNLTPGIFSYAVDIVTAIFGCVRSMLQLN